MKNIKQMFRQLAGGPKRARESEGFGSAPLEATVAQGKSLLDEGKYLEALRLAQAAVDSGSRAPHLRYLLGLCFERAGRHEEALASYQGELELFPDHAPARSRSQPLAKALAKPVARRIPNAGRSWHTSLPRETLLGLQQAVHHYTYRGVPMLKNPFDFAIYPVLLWKTKPKTIFEIGSKSGGSALWFGDMLDSFGLDGHIYSLDVVRVKDVTHPKVTFLEGDGRALEKSFTPDFLRGLPRPFLVIEDADHAYETSIATLRFFDPWLQPGEYIVVEDGIISDLDQDAACNSGPHKALKEMLSAQPDAYEIDPDYCDFFGYNLTWCTNGFLKKLAPRT
jgi:cephalosporin hydroxylase